MKKCTVFMVAALFFLSSASFGADEQSFRIEEKKNEIISLLTKKQEKKTTTLNSVLLRPTLDNFRYVGFVDFRHPVGTLSRIAREIENYHKWINVKNQKDSPVIFKGIKGERIKSGGMVTIFFTSSLLGKKRKLVYPLKTSIFEARNGESAVLMRYSSDRKIIRKLNIDIVLIRNGKKKTRIYYDLSVFFDWRGYFATNDMFYRYVTPVMKGIIDSINIEASKRK